MATYTSKIRKSGIHNFTVQRPRPLLKPRTECFIELNPNSSMIEEMDSLLSMIDIEDLESGRDLVARLSPVLKMSFDGVDLMFMPDEDGAFVYHMPPECIKSFLQFLQKIVTQSK